MASDQLTAHEYHLVADVAAREEWLELTEPPVDGPMRTVSEQQAVLRYRSVLRPVRRVPVRGVRQARERVAMNPRIARLMVVGLSGVGFLACWIASPTRTLGSLAFVGAVMGLAMLRRRGAGRMSRRHPLRTF